MPLQHLFCQRERGIQEVVQFVLPFLRHVVTPGSHQRIPAQTTGPPQEEFPERSLLTTQTSLTHRLIKDDKIRHRLASLALQLSQSRTMKNVPPGEYK